MDSSYGFNGPRRRHFLGWIFFGVLALAIVGGLVLWGIAAATGHFLPYYYRPFFFFPFGFIFFALFLFFIFRFLFWGWGWLGWRRRGYYSWGADAREILKIRYARGEISKEQFEQMNRDLDATK